MSVYFIHLFLGFCMATFLVALITPRGKFFNSIVCFASSSIIGILLFNASKAVLLKNFISIIVDTFLIITLIYLVFTLFFGKNLLKFIGILALGLCYGYIYGGVSDNFSIFQNELLDSLSVANLFIVIFAIISLIIFYATLYRSVFCKRLFLIVAIAILIVDRVAFLIIALMQNGSIKTSSSLLSIVAKIIYFNNFLPYLFTIFALILAFISFLKRPKPADKNSVLNSEFRKNMAIRVSFRNNLISSFSVSIFICGFLLYYDLIASAPPKLSPATIVEPKDGVFKFDIEMLRDNNLHRYAYIADDGKEVRFFLINRFKDKLVPTAVFDSCSICGDMGYTKKGDELICISCNVRIFLPTVGKMGGCNPIPMEFENDGKFLTIKLKTIEDGAVYFSKIVEKMVIDPVSKNKVSNLKSKFTYLYYGKTYFFENRENLELFENNPTDYVVVTEGK